MSRAPIDDYLEAGRCRIERVVLSKRDIQYAMRCAGAYAGTLTVTRMTTERLCHQDKDARCSRRFGRPTLVGDTNVRLVESVFTPDFGRRRGIATKLYEAAAKDACRAAEPLVSAFRITGARSNDFWKKQHAKGRATVIGTVAMDAGQRPIPMYALDCAKGTSLSGVKKKRRKAKR